MKSGSLGIPVGDDQIIESEILTVEREGDQLKRSVNSKSQVTTPSGHRMVEGSVAIEQNIEYKEAEIDDNGNVQSRTQIRKTAESARFIQVQNNFVILESGAPRKMFDILGRAADCAFETAEIDLDEFVIKQDEETLWMLGFYEHGTQAETGTLYGSDMGEDPIASDIFQNSRCNQIGIEHFYADDAVKARMSESGFVEVYSPDYNEEEFIDYLVDNISQHIQRPTV